MNSHDNSHSGSCGKWVFWGFAAVAAYFLWTEHRAHVIQYLPFLLLLACPIMHLFHHHEGHGRHDGADERALPHNHEKQPPEAKP